MLAKPSAACRRARTASRGAAMLASPLAHSSFTAFSVSLASPSRPWACSASASGTAVSPSELSSPISTSTSQLSRSTRSAAAGSPAASSRWPRLRLDHCAM